MWPKNPDKRKDMFVYLIGKVNRKEELHVNSGHAYLRREFSIREPNNKIDEFWEDFKKKHEDQWGNEKASPQEKLEKWLDKHYSISFDEVQCVSRIVDKQTKEELLSEDIYHIFLKTGLDISISKFNAAIGFKSRKNRYNPIEQWFEKCGIWDGEDYLEKLADCFTLTTKDPEQIDFFKSMLKKHLVRSVANVIGKATNKYCLVITGKKSTSDGTAFVKWLNPFIADKIPYMFTSSYVDLRIYEHSKPMLAQNYIYLLDDVEKFNKKSWKAFFELVTKEKIEVKMRKDKVVMKRMCSFWATSRKSVQSSEDKAISSTLLCFEIDSIAEQSYSGIGKEQLYAQCIHLYKSGFRCSLTAKEKKLQEALNAKCFRQT